MGYTIREVSEILKIPVSTIRYYENLGLLPVIQRIEGNVCLQMKILLI